MKYVKNEWMKLWSKKGTWAMLIMTVLIVLLPGTILKVFEEPTETAEQRKEANEETIQFYESILEDEELSEDTKEIYKQEKMLAEYRLEHDLPPNDVTTLDRFMSLSLDITVMFISIFVVIVAAGIVSQEFGTGTIKMLLTRPVARWKILLSKLVTTIIYGFTLYIVGLAVSFLVGIVLFGSDTTVQLSIVDGVIQEQSPWEAYFKTIALSFGSFFMSIFFAFMIGSIFGSSSLAVGLTLFISLMGSTVVMLMSKYEFAKYIWISNDLIQFAPGYSKYIEDLTLPFSLTVNIVYAFVFLAFSFIYFMKRDVTA